MYKSRIATDFYQEPLKNIQMKIKCTMSFLLCLSTIIVCAQAQTEYKLEPLGSPLENSNYNHLTVIDDRINPYLGFIQTGAFNKYRSLEDEMPLKQQMEEAFLTSIGKDSKNGDMILYLRNFSFAEVTKAFSESGYFAFAADIYGSNESGFSLLQKIDTVLEVRAMDVSKKMLEKGNAFYNHFITSNVQKLPESTEILTSNDIINTRHREKSIIPLYNTQTFTDGIYNTYESFKNQVPDDQNFQINYKNERPLTITAKDNPKKKIDSRDFYAIVDQNKIYINTSHGYVPLEKSADDFYFTGIGLTRPNSANIIMASVFFGALGAIVASSNSLTEQDFIIDYSTGNFISLPKK